MNYCAFLRGVNVNGTTMKMEEVCAVFRDCAMQNVTSVLATGNILFSSEMTTSHLKSVLETALSKKFEYDAHLFLKTEKEIKDIIANNPFTDSPELHQYIFLGEPTVEELLMKEFNSMDIFEQEKGVVVDHTFYWQVPKGMTLNSNFGKILGRKSLKNQLTSRNKNTLIKVENKFNSFSK